MIAREKLAEAFLDAANTDGRDCFVWCGGYNSDDDNSDDDSYPYDFENALIDGNLNLIAGVDAILEIIARETGLFITEASSDNSEQS
jgi:hypothetical protein